MVQTAWLGTRVLVVSVVGVGMAVDVCTRLALFIVLFVVLGRCHIERITSLVIISGIEIA
jgi:hypothetical protein